MLSRPLTDSLTQTHAPLSHTHTHTHTHTTSTYGGFTWVHQPISLEHIRVSCTMLVHCGNICSSCACKVRPANSAILQAQNSSTISSEMVNDWTTLFQPYMQRGSLGSTSVYGWGLGTAVKWRSIECSITRTIQRIEWMALQPERETMTHSSIQINRWGCQNWSCWKF